jgi:hypothetical protein
MLLVELAASFPGQGEEPDREAARIARIGGTRGLDQLRDENRAAWRELWQGRIRLLGAGRRWQSYVDAAQYYLHASAHPSGLFSTAMFGLAWPSGSVEATGLTTAKWSKHWPSRFRPMVPVTRVWAARRRSI